MDPAAAGRVARLRAALTGGTGARFADRAEIEAAARLERSWPGTREQAAAALAFAARAARRAVTEDQAAGVILGASGYPGAVPLHAAAAAAAPAARFCYAYRSAELAFTAAGLLAAPGVTIVQGDVREPEALLSLPEARDLGAPLQVQAQMCAHYWDGEACAALAARYAALLPAGSSLAWSLWVPDGSPAGERFARDVEHATGARVHGHSVKDIESWMEDAGLSAVGPGVADARSLRLGWADAELAHRSPGRVVGAVYRKAGR